MFRQWEAGGERTVSALWSSASLSPDPCLNIPSLGTQSLETPVSLNHSSECLSLMSGWGLDLQQLPDANSSRGHHSALQSGLASRHNGDWEIYPRA
jgi:hypothetical protein